MPGVIYRTIPTFLVKSKLSDNTLGFVRSFEYQVS